MSNEPKWTVVVQSSDNYIVTNGQLTYGFMWEDDANDLCDKLNRLESEVEMLRQEIRNRLSDENKALARVGKLTSDLDRCKSEYSDRVKLYDQSIKNLIEASKQEIARCKSERLAAEEILNELIERSGMFAPYPFNVIIEKATAFRASQQTQEGKG